MLGHLIEINRAAVLMLWAAVVSERLGFEHDESLTVGKAAASLRVHAEGVRLGRFEPTPSSLTEQRRNLTPGEHIRVEIMRRTILVSQTRDGLRALARSKPISPAFVERYLEGEFGASLQPAQQAMTGLARASTPGELAAKAHILYKQFQPQIRGGGNKIAAILDLDTIARLARKW